MSNVYFQQLYKNKNSNTINVMQTKTTKQPAQHSYGDCDCNCVWCDIGGHCHNKKKGCNV